MRLQLAIAILVFAFSATAVVERVRTPTAKLDDSEVKLGAELYGRMCAVCHGANGEGYKADDAPRIAHPDFLATVTDDYLVRAIANGRSNTTMSAWGRSRGGPLSPAEVDAVVAFMRTWDKRADRPRLDERKPVGSAARGSVTYLKECRHCHGVLGQEGPSVHIGGHELLQSASTGFLRFALRHGRPGTAMPAFGDKLGQQGMDDILTLLESWKRSGRPITPPHGEHTPPAPPLPLGPVPLNPDGPDPVGFAKHPATTKIDIIKRELDRNARMVLMDARTPSDYLREHITGAVSIPFYDPTPYFDKLPKDTWLVAYCSCPHAESRTLATKLVDKGFKKVTVLDEGLGVWKRKKHPTSTGDKP
jgi:cytochrome c oxidase cbb3-type subunit 3/ubiquinol-cytochrome c reductase cytochrome c subunit